MPATAPVVDDNFKDELDESTALSVSNKHLFVRSLFNYIASVIPDLHFSFEEPKVGYCLTMSFNLLVGLSVNHGFIWGGVKEAVRTEVSMKTRMSIITDDTVCDDKNVSLVIEKMADAGMIKDDGIMLKVNGQKMKYFSYGQNIY